MDFGAVRREKRTTGINQELTASTVIEILQPLFVSSGSGTPLPTSVATWTLKLCTPSTVLSQNGPITFTSSDSSVIATVCASLARFSPLLMSKNFHDAGGFQTPI